MTSRLADPDVPELTEDNYNVESRARLGKDVDLFIRGEALASLGTEGVTVVLEVLVSTEEELPDGDVVLEEDDAVG